MSKDYVRPITNLLCEIFATVLVLSFSFVVSANAQAKSASNPPATESDLVRATREYKTSSESLMQLQQAEVEKASQKLEELQKLVNDGLIAKKELENAQQNVAALQTKVAATRQQISDSEKLIADIQAAEQLAKAQEAFAAKNRALVTPTMLRYNGTVNLGLAANLSSVENFFTTRFGRALPTSAIGQSSTHDLLGYDHRNAFDVAVHPDSLEGKAVIAYLQSKGIPFLAFRSAIPGVATGPHIHVGAPSHRLA